MPITLDWEDPAAFILRKRYVGRWTWEEFAEVNEAQHAIVASTERRVDIIVDMLETNYVAPALIDNLRPYLATLRLNGGFHVIVAKAIIPEIVQLLKDNLPLYGQFYVYATSIERARKIIDAARRDKRWTDDLPPVNLN